MLMDMVDGFDGELKIDSIKPDGRPQNYLMLLNLTILAGRSRLGLIPEKIVSKRQGGH